MGQELVTIGQTAIALGNIAVLLAVLFNMRKDKKDNPGDNGTKEKVDKHTEEIGQQTGRVNVLSDKVVIHGERIARVESEVSHCAEEIAGQRKENRDDHNRIYEAIEARNGGVS